MSALKNAVASPLAWTATFFYGTWRLVVEQKLFLHAFLVERLGNRRVPKLPLGYRNVLALKGIMLWQQLARNPEALREARKRTYARIHRRLIDRAIPEGRVQTIPEYRVGEISPRRFYKEHVKRGVPCVIRGFAGSGATDRRLERLAECFPDAVVQVFDKRTKTIVSTSLDALHRDQGRSYIPQQALLEQDPAFRAHFDIERSGEYFRVMNRPSKPVVSFLIIGLGKGLNANYHCEESPNWYLAVSGTKRWTLIEAEYSWLLYPSARGTGMRRFSEFLADEKGEPRDRQAYPLVGYAPRYEFELHPGDVVSFPAWMWHKTVNLDDEGLGVTCRYAVPTVMSNRYFRCLDLLSPSFWKSSAQMVSALIRGDFTGIEESGEYNDQEVVLY